MKRTLKRELKGLEIAKREPLGRSVAGADIATAAKAGVVPSVPCWSAWARAPGERVVGRWTGPGLRSGVPVVTAHRLPCRRLDQGNLKPRPVPWVGETNTGVRPVGYSMLVPTVSDAGPSPAEARQRC